MLGFYEEADWYCIPLTLRNDSGKEVTWYSTGDFSVNGWTASDWLDGDSEVISGGMAFCTLRLLKSDLVQVLLPGRISGSLSLYGEAYNSTTISVDLTTSAGEGKNQELDLSHPVWSDDLLTLYLISTDLDGYSRTFRFYAESRSTDTCWLIADEETLNGAEFSTYCSAHLPAGGKVFFTLELDRDELEDAGIYRNTPLESLDFVMELSEYEYGIYEQEADVHIDLTQLEH